jgi:hypothetical protein
MKQNIVLTYVGNGGHIIGWPARDLTSSDIERLSREGTTTEQLLQSKLYEYPPIPAKSKQADEIGKE